MLEIGASNLKGPFIYGDHSKKFNWKYPTIYLAHQPNSANYFWKKVLSHVHCPWYKWWKESIYQLFSWPKLLQSDVKCKTQKRQDIKNWCLFVALTQFIFLLLYFLCAYVGKTGNVTISLQVSRLLLPVSLPYHTLFANSFYHDKLLRFDKLSLRKWPTYLHKYSRVHKSSDSFFSKILEKTSIVQK